MVWSRSENASFSDAILYQHDHFAKTGGDKYRENSKRERRFLIAITALLWSSRLA